MQQDNPQQGPHGIAKRRGFEDGAQIRQQRRVDLREQEASTYLSPCLRPSSELTQTV